ncbi:M14 family metallocarboxypeptidase [Lentibacillus halophilus]|uniref:M14 family metallocarboxypeptidase n=1 Tax=Lentibacillus halophilus TaxID=295065 RepID=A0ABN0ZE71_9BACI
MKVTIRPGDSLQYYSELFDIPFALIDQSNSEINGQPLTAGRNIHIPGYTLHYQSTAPNDTLKKIAKEKRLSVDMLQSVNPSIIADHLPINDTIAIPERVNERILTDFHHYTFDTMINDIQKLTTIYPFITQQVIGHSVMGKDIIEIQVGNGNKQVHLNGSFHANEWITTPVIMRFINEYARALTNNLPLRSLSTLPLLTDTNLSVVPMVNPDGVDLVLNGASAAGNRRRNVLSLNNHDTDFSNWKANIAGVDLNNQYPARRETETARKPDSPQPRDYPGPYPLSEPESMAMATLANTREFSRVSAFHTQGDVIYWGYEGIEPSSAQTIVDEYGRVSGYTPVRYVDNYAGFKDWFIKNYQRPGFTVELGSGVNPLPFTQFDEIYQASLGIMLANLYM